MTLDAPWPLAALEDASVHITVGFVGPQAKLFVDDGVPLLRGQNIKPFRLDLTNLKYVPDEVHARWKKSALEAGDVVIVRVGYPGVACVIPPGLGALNAASLVIVRTNADILRPQYLALLLNSPWGKARIQELLVGSAQQVLNTKAVAGLRVPIPPISYQDAALTVFGVLDDLIENNRRRIALLEQMAQAIYREWFVHPPLQDASTNEERTSSVREGWQMSELGNELDVLESGTRPRGGVDPNERGVPSAGAENVVGLGRYRFEAEKFVSEAFFESMRRGQVQSGDVLLYKDGAHIGRHSMFRDGFPHDRCAINEHVFRLRARPPLTQNYLYFWLDRPETVDMIVGLNSNAAQPGISQKKLGNVPIPVPPPERVELWERTVDPLIALLFNLAKQSRYLQRIRDSLLPKLVTGAIDVSKLDLDALLEESAA